MSKKIKIGFLFCIFAFLGAIAFARAGLGGSFSYSASTTPQTFASFSVRADVSPWAVFFNAHLEENTVSLFLDDWFVNERVAEHLDFFVLWGMSFGATFEDDETAVTTGARFGGGLDFFFFRRHMELFTQMVWNPYFGVKKSDGDYALIVRPLNFPCTAGLRVWF